MSDESPIIFTDACCVKVADLIAEENNPNLMLRVFVNGGGCSGFQYGFTFDEIKNDDDFEIEKNGLKFRFIPTNAPKHQLVFGVAQDNPELLAQIDKGLSAIKANGSYDKIVNKWFGTK